MQARATLSPSHHAWIIKCSDAKLFYKNQEVNLKNQAQNRQFSRNTSPELGLPDGRYFTIILAAVKGRYFENKYFAVTLKRTNADFLKL